MLRLFFILLIFVACFSFFTLHAEAYQPVLTSVQINPGLLPPMTLESILYLSTLAFDQYGAPIFSGVTYDWGISSSGSIGNIIVQDREGKIATLKVTGADEGDLFVIAHYNGTQSTGSVHIKTTDNLGICSADINSDGVVDLRDYSLLVQFLFQSRSEIPVPRADINYDGIVDIRDYSILARSFFKTCLR